MHRSFVKFVFVALALVVFSEIDVAQAVGDSAPDRGTVEGIVVNLQNGRVVPRATVVIRNLQKVSESRSARADGQGHFVIKNLQPGSYHLSAEHVSFFSSTRHQVFQYRVDIAAGESRSGLVLQLQPAAVVTGQITDDNSEPMQHVRVQLLDRVYRNERLATEMVGSALSDDRGIYRIYDVRPGLYYLVAELQPSTSSSASTAGGAGTTSAAGSTGSSRNNVEIPPAADFAYSAEFYPETTDLLQAQPVTVGAGDETHVNFVLTAKPSVAIKGKVVNGVTGEPASNAAVATLWTEYLDELGIIVNASPTDGTFETRGLPPGRYTLRAAFVEDGIAYTVQQRVEAGPHGLENVSLNAIPDTLVSGRVQLEVADPEQRPPQRVELAFQSNTSPARAEAVAMMRPGSPAGAPELAFQVRLHPGDRYSVTARNLPANYFLKAVSVDGHQVERNQVTTTDRQSEMNLVVSSEGGYIQGLVLDDNSNGVSASVVLVPEAVKRDMADLYRKVSSDKEGRFGIRGVPPGNYDLIAFDDVDLNALISQPEILNRFQDRAVPITIEEQQDYTTALKVIRGFEEVRLTVP